MRAVIQERYGSPRDLVVREVPRPVPADDEVLVRVRAASVHPDVWHVVTGHPQVLRLMGSGVRRPSPQIPGTDVAGTVEVVGGAVARFEPGDAVFGETLRGIQWVNGGAYAEYVCVPEDNLAAKPAALSFEQAAALPTAGLIVLLNLQDREHLQPGQQVLVNGAGGGVGSIAVQLAKASGATVTAVDAAAKLDLLREYGADHVIDYGAEDFTTSGRRYDLVFDVPGNHPFGRVRRVLADDGSYVLIGHDGFGATASQWWGNLPRMLGMMARAPFVRQLPTTGFRTPPKSESMATLVGLAETGRLTAVIEQTYPLDDAGRAIDHLASGTARGRIVITP